MASGSRQGRPAAETRRSGAQNWPEKATAGPSGIARTRGHAVAQIALGVPSQIAIAVAAFGRADSGHD